MIPEAGKKPNFRKNKKTSNNQYNIALNPKTHNRISSGCAAQVGVIGEIGAPTIKQP